MEVNIWDQNGTQTVSIKSDGITYEIIETKSGRGNGLSINMREPRRIFTIVPINHQTIRIGAEKSFTAPMVIEKGIVGDA